jgi:predicted naringenin-chalcone synthase
LKVAARKQERVVVVVVDVTVLRFRADQPAAGELVVGADLAAANEAAVIVAAEHSVVVLESTTDVTADVKSRPVDRRRSHDRRF